MCKRGGGARGPARAKGRTGLLSAASTPAGTGLPSHRKFLVLPRVAKHVLGEVTFNKDGVNGLNKKSTDNRSEIDLLALVLCSEGFAQK